ncbi:DHHA1 domain-containing protein [Tissierella sp.]|uniref:alanyl-tRNA editing protein n=1 Tax=Tissierella sp. TaxID=41274 RepID=UPI0028583488|nr:DHHA1 domain-containing protein [Tissierella sp.]MDR7857095.1 DHHA1 domain-containing protein [Tissierella sp.]
MTNKLYLDNPYVREIDSRIVDKTYKDGKYYIKLNRTIFYPHLSGGQPGDKGTINGVEVLEVYEENSDIIHVVKDNIQSDKVTLSIDWENRLDNMQQHTGQHLLSAAFYKLYNGETIGFHLGRDYVYIDVTLPDFSEDEMDKIEIYTNRIISSNFEIKSYYVEKNEVNKIPVRKQPTVDLNIRIVEIDNIDFSPCAGTHLRNTGEIGIIKIRRWEKYKGNIRIEFVCGNRALFDYRWKNKYIKEIGVLLSSKDTDVLDKVHTLFNQKEELEKENRSIKAELVRYEGEELFRNAIKIKTTPLVYKLFDDKELKEISSLASYLNNNYNLVQMYGSRHENIGQFFISVSKQLNINLKNIFKDISEEFDLKGGGTPETVQGKCSIENLEVLLNRFSEKIKKEIDL